MKLQQLRVLLAVAQHGSIHEAARASHTTQPALSKAISELERELDRKHTSELQSP